MTVMRWNKSRWKEAASTLVVVGLVPLLVLHLVEWSREPPRYSNGLLLRTNATQQVVNPSLKSSDAAIVSAVTGKIDRPSLQPDAGIFVYDETMEPLPFPRHDANQRLRAKYFRMSTHWLHPEYSAYIWVDGAFQIDDPIALRSFMVDALGSADCAFFKHPDRQTIVQESEAILGWIAEGSSYLRVRYEHEPMKAQVNAYIEEGFPVDEYPLIASGLFIRRNLPHINAAFDHWLVENFKWTIQDQLSLPYVLWKHNLTFNMINSSIWSGPHHKHMGHASPIQ